MLQRFLDIGHFPLGVAVAVLILLIVLFGLGIKHLNAAGSAARYPALLLILAAIAYLANQVMVSSLQAFLYEIQITASMDWSSRAADLAMLEYQKMLFSGLALLAVLAAGILVFFSKPEGS